MRYYLQLPSFLVSHLISFTLNISSCRFHLVSILTSEVRGEHILVFYGATCNVVHSFSNLGNHRYVGLKLFGIELIFQKLLSLLGWFFMEGLLQKTCLEDGCVVCMEEDETRSHLFFICGSSLTLRLEGGICEERTGHNRSRRKKWNLACLEQ